MSVDEWPLEAANLLKEVEERKAYLERLERLVAGLVELRGMIDADSYNFQTVKVAKEDAEMLRQAEVALKHLIDLVDEQKIESKAVERETGMIEIPFDVEGMMRKQRERDFWVGCVQRMVPTVLQVVDGCTEKEAARVADVLTELYGERWERGGRDE